MGSIPIGSVSLDGPLSLGYLVKIPPCGTSGFEPRTIRQLMDFPTRPLSQPKSTTLAVRPVLAPP